MQQGAVAVHGSLLIHGNPEVGRVAAKRLAEETGRRHADDGERVAFHDDGGTDHRRISTVSQPPGMVAQYDDGCGGGSVVIRSEKAPAERAYTERGEVIPGDILSPQRLGSQAGPLPPYAQASAGGLEGSDILELRRFALETLVQGIGVHSPSLLRTTLHAAIVAIADAV
jgi:hypothetical protein